MKFWVGVTDRDWFDQLSRLRPDEVNFWQPGGRPPFTNAPVGMPFLFKLKYPVNAIVGGGWFVTFSRLEPRMVWDVFGDRNGCSSFQEMVAKIGGLRRPDRPDAEIGCTVLVNPFFLAPSTWVRDPDAFFKNIVVGKGYDSDWGDGQVLWNRVVAAMAASDSLGLGAPGPSPASDPTSTPASGLVLPGSCLREPAPDGPRYGTPTLVAQRLGQCSFQLVVADAYHRRCAITGENTLEVLQAAHIFPYAQGGPHAVTNGLLLRMDFHKLFDAGLVSVAPDYTIHVSPRIHQKYYNGKAYYRLDNQPLTVLPTDRSQYPDRERLDWHFNTVFQR